MRITQRKGDIATTHAICIFTSMGYDVSLPITESASYDLIVDDGIKLFKVQVKYSSDICVDLRRIHSNSKGYVVKFYNHSDFDWLYVYNPKLGSFLIKDDLSNRSTINLNDKYKLEVARLDEEIALKATEGKTFGGSSPSASVE